MLWRVSDCPVADFGAAQARLAAHYHSDASIANPSRVLRLPGTLHLKDPANPQLVTFFKVDPAPRPLAELTAGLPAAPVKMARPAHTAPPVVDWDLPANVERGRDYLRQRVAAGSVAIEHDETGKGGNITLFKIACQMRDFMISEETARELVWEEFNPHCQPPWAAQDETFLGPFRSAYGGNAENPQPGRDRERSGAEIFRSFIGQTAPAEDEDGLMSLEAMDARPNPRELVKGFLIEGELIGILGMPKHGKTFVALDISYSIMSGTPVLTYFEVLRQGPAVYLSGEGHQGMKRRWHAWKTPRGIDKPNSELPFVYATFVPQAQNAVAEAKQTAAKIKRKFDRMGIAEAPVIITIDTQARAIIGLDENSTDSANKYFLMLETLKQEIDRLWPGSNVTILSLVHASNKDEHKKTVETLDVRGTSAFVASYDTLFTMMRNTANGTVRMHRRFAKDPNGDMDDFFFRLVNVAVPGFEHPGAALQLVPPPEVKHSDSNAPAREDLRDKLIKFGAIGPMNGLRRWQLAWKITETDCGPYPGDVRLSDPLAEARRLERLQAWKSYNARQLELLRNGSGLRAAPATSPRPRLSACFTKT